MKRYITIILLLVLLSGCAADPTEAPATTAPAQTTVQTQPTQPPDPIEALIGSMTPEEKVGQLFMVQPESMGVETDPGAITPELLARYPVGGFLITGDNIAGAEQIRQLTAALAATSGLPPLIATDEEGGMVSRFANKKFLNLPKYKNAATVGSSEDPDDALEMGRTIGSYLHSFGINMDLAPVADVNTNPKNPIIGKRAFSGDPETVRSMTAAMAAGLREQGIIPTYKHFPGHGDTAQDSHTELAVSHKTLEQLRSCEWLPYEDLSPEICVMAAHVALPEVTGSMTPATLSPEIIDGFLRGELGFTGVVITDGMEMRAIANHYSDGEAAILAIRAGCDMILQPKDFEAAYQAVLAALKDGTLPESRIDQSLTRILKLKQAYGLI